MPTRNQPKTFRGSADYVFQRIAAGKPENMSVLGGKKIEARKWFRQRALEVTQVVTPKFVAQADENRKLDYISKANIGQMFIFAYDAKLKKRLPYWDMFPLIFVVDIGPNFFYGINMHYLPPAIRAQMMDALYKTTNNKTLSEQQRLLINYSRLKRASTLKYFKPCFKKYLVGHVGSRYMKISPDEWDMALLLPTERFQKANKEQVWQDSVESVSDANNQ